MSSNRHWPNLFKSKPSTSQHQWHHMTTSSNISGPNLSSNEGTSSREEEREGEGEGTSCTGNIHGMSNIPQNQQAYSSFLHNEGQAYPPYVDHHAAAETFKPHQNLLSPPLNDSTIIHSGAESRVSSSNASSFTVFINYIPIDVPMGPINVKALFGPNAVLFHSYGQPVIMDEQGFTLQALQQGAMYYLVCL
ncbi:hypothetical protein SUGI_0360990 [Cryptomeria japonica]|nr:hypothetical protein SUGI_0360990 [Cryptomeria japonica]